MDFKNGMICIPERWSEFSQPSGKPVCSGDGNLMVLMVMLAFPTVLEMSGSLRGVVTTVVLSPLEAKTLASSIVGMM